MAARACWFLIPLVTACHGSTPVDGACPESVAQYCRAQPQECPTSSQFAPFCDWLSARGEHSFGGPVTCPGQGTGWEVDGPDGAVWYLFDDAGLTAIVDFSPEGGCRAGAGAATGLCVNWIGTYGCAIDAGHE